MIVNEAGKPQESQLELRACGAHQQLPSDWSRAALPVLEVVPLASQARSAHSARAAGRARPLVGLASGATHFKKPARRARDEPD